MAIPSASEHIEARCKLGPERTTEICNLVQQQLLYYLRDALEGSETIMKEVWEECADAAEFVIAEAEIGRIIEAIQE